MAPSLARKERITRNQVVGGTRNEEDPSLLPPLTVSHPPPVTVIAVTLIHFGMHKKINDFPDPVAALKYKFLPDKIPSRQLFALDKVLLC